MPYRPNAGRPRGSTKAAAAAEAVARSSSGLTPLDWMLSVMRDPAASELRKDRMAIAAAPYCHSRAGDAVPGKREQAGRDAVAGKDTAWDELQ
jgi:hypothetical protein